MLVSVCACAHMTVFFLFNAYRIQKGTLNVIWRAFVKKLSKYPPPVLD